MVPPHIWSPHMWSVVMSYMTLMVPHTLYGIGILWFPLTYMEQVMCGYPTCMYGPPTCTIWLLSPLPYMEQVSYGPPPHVHMVPHMWSVFMSYVTLMVPHTLYGIGIVCPPLVHMVPHMYCMTLMAPIPYMEWASYGPPYLIWNRYHMVPPHVKCPHVLYDSYGPPYLIWNRYCMSPTCTYGPPHVLYDSYGPHTLYGIGILWSPLPYMEQVSYGPPTCEVSSCLIWLLWSPIPYMENISYGHMIFSGQLW